MQQLSKMSFENLCNRSYVQPPRQMSNKKRRFEHTPQELEAATQLTLFLNFPFESVSQIREEMMNEIAPSSPSSSIEESDESMNKEEESFNESKKKNS